MMFSRLTDQGPGGRSSKTRQRFRPLVECLEDRRLLSLCLSVVDDGDETYLDSGWSLTSGQGYARDVRTAPAGVGEDWAAWFLYGPDIYAPYSCSEPFHYAGALDTIPYGLNNLGQVAGQIWTSPTPRGFLYDGTTFTPLLVPGSTETAALDVNDNGVAVGHSSVQGRNIRGMVYNGGYGSLAVPGATWTTANAINNAGDILLRSSRGDHLYRNGTYTPLDLPPPEPGAHASAYDINDLGWVSGLYSGAGYSRGFIYDGETYTPLEYPGARSTWPWRMNNLGWVTGFYQDAGGKYHGFLYDGVTYRATEYPGSTEDYGRGINDAGQLVGTAITGGRGRGFFANPQQGSNFEVQVTWTPGPDRASNTPYWIFDGGTFLAEIRVDQRQAPVGETINGSVFQTLTTATASSGLLWAVTANDADGLVVTDALRVVARSLAPFPGRGLGRAPTNWGSDTAVSPLPALAIADLFDEMGLSLPAHAVAAQEQADSQPNRPVQSEQLADVQAVREWDSQDSGPRPQRSVGRTRLPLWESEDPLSLHWTN